MPPPMQQPCRTVDWMLMHEPWRYCDWNFPLQNATRISTPRKPNMSIELEYDVKRSSFIHWRRLHVKCDEKQFESELRMEYKAMEATFSLNGGPQNYVLKYTPPTKKSAAAWELTRGDDDDTTIVKLTKKGNTFESACENGPNLSMEARAISYFVVYGNLNEPKDDEEQAPSVIATFRMWPGTQGCKDGAYDLRIHRDLPDHLGMFYFAVFELVCYQNLRSAGNPSTFNSRHDTFSSSLFLLTLCFALCRFGDISQHTSGYRGRRECYCRDIVGGAFVNF